MPELPADEKLEEEQEIVTDSFPEVKVTHYYADVELEDDTKRKYVEVVAEKVTFLSSNKKDE